MVPKTLRAGDLDVKANKKSAFSCEPCRQRKVKCDGKSPARCTRCIARKENCVYKLNPTLSYTNKLEARIIELEEALERVQRSPHNQTGPTANTTSSPPTSSPSAGTGFASAFPGIAFDAKGGVSYQAATSLFHLPSRIDEHRTPRSVQEAQVSKERLVQNAWEQRALEVLAETPEPFQYLLNNHWCWIQPLFNFVYRPAFTRDMTRMGPYYSHTLLNAMLGHSIRWCRSEPEIQHLLEPYDGGDLFKRHARTLVWEEISTGNCNIPTIQTLLLLSAQECSAGNRTSAFIYSRSAFAILENLGITLDLQKFASGNAHLSDEANEVHRRLFWACVFWDTMLALYTSRSLSLATSSVSPPQLIMDDSAEDEIWIPHGVYYPEGQEYPQTKAHSVSCFTQMCRLAMIYREVHAHIYDPAGLKTGPEIEDCLIRESFAMRQWWQDLPYFLRIDAHSLPKYCPPSHIVTLNCLYHTFKILLYRPMLFRRPEAVLERGAPDPTHFKECLTSASSIIAVFDLFCRTFSYSRVILSLAYSLYTAASIFLLQLQASSSREEHMLHSMRFCVQALDRVKVSSPVIGNALRLLLNALADTGIDPARILEQPQTMTTAYSPTNSKSAAPSPGYMPLAPAVFNLEDLDFTPEMFATFSNLEPISAAVGGEQIT